MFNIKRIISSAVDSGYTNQIDDIIAKTDKSSFIGINMSDYSVNIPNSFYVDVCIRVKSSLIDIYYAVDRTTNEVLHDFKHINIRDLDTGISGSHSIPVDESLISKLKELIAEIK